MYMCTAVADWVTAFFNLDNLLRNTYKKIARLKWLTFNIICLSKRS